MFGTAIVEVCVGSLYHRWGLVFGVTRHALWGYFGTITTINFCVFVEIFTIQGGRGPSDGSYIFRGFAYALCYLLSYNVDIGRWGGFLYVAQGRVYLLAYGNYARKYRRVAGTYLVGKCGIRVTFGRGGLLATIVFYGVCARGVFTLFVGEYVKYIGVLSTLLFIFKGDAPTGASGVSTGVSCQGRWAFSRAIVGTTTLAFASGVYHRRVECNVSL